MKLLKEHSKITWCMEVLTITLLVSPNKLDQYLRPRGNLYQISEESFIKSHLRNRFTTKQVLVPQEEIII